MSLNVRVLTPDKVVWDAKAEELVLPSSTGKIGILVDHAPLLTGLDIGVMRLKSDEVWASIVLMGGFAEVEKNEVTIICTEAEASSSIDLKLAKQELEKRQFNKDIEDGQDHMKDFRDRIINREQSETEK